MQHSFHLDRLYNYTLIPLCCAKKAWTHFAVSATAVPLPHGRGSERNRCFRAATVRERCRGMQFGFGYAALWGRLAACRGLTKPARRYVGQALSPATVPV